MIYKHPAKWAKFLVMNKFLAVFSKFIVKILDFFSNYQFNLWGGVKQCVLFSEQYIYVF